MGGARGAQFYKRAYGNFAPFRGRSLCAAARGVGCGGEASVCDGQVAAVAGGGGAGGGFAGAAFGPLAEGGDLAVHELGERDGMGHRFDDVFGRWLPAFGECLVEGVDKDGFVS